MAPDKLENCAQCCFNKFDCRLFICKFIEIAFCLSLSLSVISKSLAQPWCKRCSLSALLNVRFTTNEICMMINKHVARRSRNKMMTTWDLHCCLVQQWEALRTCYSAFPITKTWCFDQDVKVVPGATFTKRTCNRCGSLQKRGDVIGIFQLALHLKFVFHIMNTSTMLRRPEPTKERVEPTILLTVAIEITHLTRFVLLLLLRSLRYVA